MKEIYIVLTQTGTMLANTIKFLKHTEYNHASISLDKELNSLYSFGRINPYMAFPASFVKEGIDIGTFKRFKNTKCKILKLNVEDEQYDLMTDKINYFADNKKKYKFNVPGLFYAAINVKKERPNSYYCSEFVKHTLDSGNVDTSMIPDVILPEHLLMIDGLEVVYEGLLREYKYKL